MLMLQILIVEDDPKLSDLYSIVLNKAGYKTLCAANGQEAWGILEREHIDLIITDIMMPVMDGYEFRKTVRQGNPLVPILIITAREDFSSMNRGFLLGTDDYMTKPVDVNEMILRVRALLRRSNILHEHRLVIGGTVLDYDAMTITWNGQSLMPPQKEFLLLYKLLSYPDKIFTRIQLMDEIWGRESTSVPQTVDVHINRLRRHFEDSSDFEIVTVRGLGYKAVIK